MDSEEIISIEISDSLHSNCDDSDCVDTPDPEDPSFTEASLYALLSKAYTNLVKAGNLNRCGAIPGVTSSYLATKVNGQPSCTTVWQHQKKEMEAKAFVFNAELQSQQSNGSPVLLEHYFS